MAVFAAGSGYSKVLFFCGGAIVHCFGSVIPEAHGIRTKRQKF